MLNMNNNMNNNMDIIQTINTLNNHVIHENNEKTDNYLNNLHEIGKINKKIQSDNDISVIKKPNTQTKKVFLKSSFKLQNQKINLKNLLCDSFKERDYFEYLKYDLVHETDERKKEIIENKIKEINHLNYLHFEDTRDNFILREYDPNFYNIKLSDLESIVKERKTKEKIKNQIDRLYDQKFSAK